MSLRVEIGIHGYLSPGSGCLQAPGPVTELSRRLVDAAVNASGAVGRGSGALRLVADSVMDDDASYALWDVSISDSPDGDQAGAGHGGSHRAEGHGVASPPAGSLLGVGVTRC